MSHRPQKSPPQSIRHFHDRSPIFYKIHALPRLPKAVLKPRNLHIEYSSHIHELKIIIFYSLFFSLRVSLIGLIHFISKWNIIYQCSSRPLLRFVDQLGTVWFYTVWKFRFQATDIPQNNFSSSFFPRECKLFPNFSVRSCHPHLIL